MWNIFSQGDRTKTVGVVDSEYIVHLGVPTLGVSDGNKVGSLFDSLINFLRPFASQQKVI